jgi:predicted Zn-dependent protease
MRDVVLPMNSSSTLKRSLVILALALSCPGTVVRAQSTPQFKPSHSDEDLNAIGHRNVGKGVNLFSLDREKKLGEQLSDEVERASKLLNDPVITEYLNRVVQKIAANSDARVPVSVRAIDSDVVNGFILPGGFQYINTGLILQTENEGELAGVLARGVAHTALRSSTKEATKVELMQLATIPLTILGPAGWGGYGIYQGLNLSIPITYLKFRRDAQRAADFYALQYLYKSGYDPECLVRLLERGPSQTPAATKIPETFSEFPPLSERLAPMKKEIAKLLPPQDSAIVNTAEFQQIRDRLRSLKSNETVGPPALPGKPTLRKRTDNRSPELPPLMRDCN